MAAAFRFQFLLEQTQEKSGKAARLMAEVKTQWQAALQKQEQLQQFINDYQQRFLAAQAGGLSVSQWRDYQLFLGKLDRAMVQQANDVTLIQQRFETARDQWLELQKQVKALQALADRQAHSDAVRIGKREQKELDEYAAKLMARRTQDDADE